MAEIIWQGLTSFRLRGKDATIVTDPFDRGLGLEVARPRADIVTVSRNDPRFNAVSVVKGDPHVLQAPGEYEVKGIFITGVATYADAKKGEIRGKNTVFVYELDDLVIAHLGHLGHVLTADQAEALSNVSVLLVPIGDPDGLPPERAAEVIAQLEPPIVVPMMYRTGPETLPLDPLERFAKEMGLKDWQPQEKLVLKSTDLPETTQVVILETKS